MADPRKVYDSSDTQPVTLYAKKVEDEKHAYPVLAGMLNPGLAIPEHDTVLLEYTSGNVTQVDYILASATVATLTLSYTSGNLTSVVKS